MCSRNLFVLQIANPVTQLGWTVNPDQRRNTEHPLGWSVSLG